MTWRPILVGGVFNAVNQDVYESRADPNHPKLRNHTIWLEEWATLAGVTMNFPSEAPSAQVGSTDASVLLLEDDQSALAAFAEAAFETYCAHQENLDDPAVLARVADVCGLNGAELVERTSDQAIKDRLRTNTDEAIARGAFGSPTMFVNRDRMYFGNDQLPLVRQALTG